MMYDTLAGAVLYGMPGGDGPWGPRGGGAEGGAKVLCPVPGYDRHYTVCEQLGLEMIPVDMDERGPDMDRVEELVAGDSAVKAIWCVPKYSNPTGIVYSDAVVDRLAAMKTAAGARRAQRRSVSYRIRQFRRRNVHNVIKVSVSPWHRPTRSGRDEARQPGAVPCQSLYTWCQQVV